MPPADEFKTTVAQVALRAASDHGFALAGGNALAAHGIISRPTEDIDLYADTPGAVGAAADLVAETLAAAGPTVTPVAGTDDLGEVFYMFDQEMAEYEVSGGGQVVRLQLVPFQGCRLTSPPRAFAQAAEAIRHWTSGLGLDHPR